MGIAGIVTLFTLVLGVLAVSTEYRHGTITPSLLVVPDRSRLVIAKLAAHFVAGLLIGALAYCLCAVIVLPILGARNVDTGLHGSDLVKILVVIRNQVGAIVGSLAYVFVIEPLVGIIPGIDNAVSKYGLGGLSNSLQHTTTDNNTDLLGQVPAALLLAGYALVFVVVGIYFMRRRDVTS
jgi:ABC-2 type transport system permease protein